MATAPTLVPSGGCGVYLWGLGLLCRSVSSIHCQTSCDLSPSSPGSCRDPAPSLVGRARPGSEPLPVRLGRVLPLLPLWGPETTPAQGVTSLRLPQPDGQTGRE